MRDLVHRVVVRAFRAVLCLLGLRISITGAEHLPAHGPAVLAANHTSYLDFALVGLVASRRGRLVRFLAKQASFDHPVSGPFMRVMGHVPVDRRHGAVAYRRAERALRAGQLVGVFPEATISRSWRLRPFKPGAASLAVREQVPLVPVVTWGAHRVLTVGGRRDLRRRGVAVTVLLGEPVTPVDPGDDPAAAVAVTALRLRERVDALLEQAQHGYPDAPRAGEDPWWVPRHLGGTAPEPAAALLLDDAGVAADDAATADRAVARARRRVGQAARRARWGRL